MQTAIDGVARTLWNRPPVFNTSAGRSQWAAVASAVHLPCPDRTLDPKSLATAVALVAALISGQALAQASAPPAAASAAPAPVPAVPAPAAPAATGDVQKGKLAWYGRKFAGRRTASGEAYNPDALTMAHRTLPFGTYVKVTNTANRRSVVLRVNDRGPTDPGRLGDVSLAAAQRLAMTRSGVTDAELAVVSARATKTR
jgi:rare lipoprotein A